MLSYDVTKHPKGQITVFKKVRDYSFPWHAFTKVHCHNSLTIFPFVLFILSYFISPALRAVSLSKCDCRSHFAFKNSYVYILQKKSNEESSEWVLDPLPSEWDLLLLITSINAKTWILLYWHRQYVQKLYTFVCYMFWSFSLDIVS